MPSFRVFLRSLFLLQSLSFGWVIFTDSVSAATLAFEGKISPQQLAQSWKSPFTGPVTILLDPKIGKASGLEFVVSIDDEVAFESNEFIGTSISGINLTQSSEVKFEATVPDNTEFSLDVKILVEQPSLVFLDTQNSLGFNPFDHVGFFYNDKVYESHAGYDRGLYKNVFSNHYEEIDFDYGVQASHTLGSFLGSALGPTSQAELIPIPQKDAKAFEHWISSELDRGYISNNSSHNNPPPILRGGLTPLDLKGYGGFYSEVGLIERAAEQSGISSYEGYIPNSKEDVNIIVFTGTFNAGVFYDFVKEKIRVPNESLGLCFEKTNFVITTPDNTQIIYSDGSFEKPIPDAEIYTGTLDMLSSIEYLRSISICKASSLRDGVISSNILSAQDSSRSEQEYIFLLFEQRQSGRYDIQVQDSVTEPVSEPSMIIALSALSVFGLMHGREFECQASNKRTENE